MKQNRLRLPQTLSFAARRAKNRKSPRKTSRVLRQARLIGPLIRFLIISGFLFWGCEKREVPWKPGMPLAKNDLKIAVLYITDPFLERAGYSYAHLAGIQYLRQALELRDEQIMHRINIADMDQEGIESAMRDCIALGARIIIATSWGYMDACEKLAAEFPGVVFAHASGYKSNGVNFTNYFGRIYQARYLSGLAAGLKTRTGRIGYVAAMGRENSEVTGGINAFALGVEKVNPRARILVRIIHNWFDPITERSAAGDLIAAGCDVIAQHCDTPLPQIEAQEAGVWGIGYNSDMHQDAPKAVLTSVVWNWGVYYTALARSVLDGTFTAAPYMGSLDDGMVGITPLSEALAASGSARIIGAEQERLRSGAFDVFEGVLEISGGGRTGAPGSRMSDAEILQGIHWYYRTVDTLAP
ncbi:MAG: BMP family ABC transporter substrate-binding protein [Treponema sp.]|jgi:basic membrane protein A|nr:BMP family ABC transporter substrate-binding protein [Treponema sp.]